MRRAAPRGNNALIAGGLVLFIASVASYPYLHATRGPKISKGDNALSGDAVIRGAYINTGSKDIGPDPDAHKRASTPAQAARN